ncbi:MAG: hypothetical protein RIT27_1998 [Pseudomonadota bacterium]|jgi:AmmeMemoRadiSam system protein B
MDTYIRKPILAGFFYPDEPLFLIHTIEELLKEIPPTDISPKALIVPHASYEYAGKIMATAYASLLKKHFQIKNVVLLGISHHTSFRGIAVTSKTAYLTPLGQIPVEESTVMKLLQYPQIIMFDEAHIKEHCLELQLPFLQVILQSFSLIPLVVGDISSNNISEVLKILWGNQETLVIVTSNLSYYHHYNTAQQLDQMNATLIETLRWQDLKHDQTCSSPLMGGLLQVAQQKALTAKTFAICNSGDTIGTKDRVVGYGAFGFYEK